MSLVTLNDISVLSGSVFMPLVGVWTADLVIDQPDGTGFDAGTSVTLTSEDFSLAGIVTPNRTGDFLDAVHVRVLGGKGGMAKTTTPKSFAQPGALVKDVVNSLMSDSGESLSSTTDQAFLNTNLVAWTITQMPVSQALLALLAITSPASNWRFLPDGSLFVGSESWPTNSGTFDILTNDPTDGTFDLGCEAPFITPGMALEDVGNVNRVEHQITAGKIRSHVWVDMGGSSERGLASAINALVKQAVSGIDYYALYDATVKSQSADSTTVDLQPADPRLPGMGRVPLRHGIPGCKVQVSSGAILRLGWDRGNPTMPYAALWNGGESVTQISLTATTIVLNNGSNHVARVGDNTNGHVHVESGNAGPYPVVGSTQQATDSIAENGGTVKAG